MILGGILGLGEDLLSRIWQLAWGTITPASTDNGDAASRRESPVFGGRIFVL